MQNTWNDKKFCVISKAQKLTVFIFGIHELSVLFSG